ncbi:CBS domain-containing protein [Jeongeupia naejangsanensis]|uniref:CBS domain-containing protein n=1 Tax=Jeongeupia naejangsanensis TaxID=613195 RepID=A0ABS2BPP3_9NEIS|nr:CBS domain-containing protein [Jeongeupia naejangsanensis]MBM3117602.1 CBS domain-containing protein [Jeongeupia naejangsanensis]
MKNARHLLAEKQISGTLSIAPDATVYQALQLLAEMNIGALLVMEGDNLVGMFSERDYARKVVLMGKTSSGTPVSEIMTRKLICVPPTATIDECMALITEKRIRHLPVIENDRVLGVLSIGDLVRETIADQQFTIDQLVYYIHR